MALQLNLFEEDRPTRLGRTAVSYVSALSILTRPTGMAKAYDFTLNPYKGCAFACSYCYAASFEPDPERVEAWGQWVQVKGNAVSLLRRTPEVAGASLYVGSVTDPYQPIERELELTRSLLEVLVEMRPQPRIVIQTRSPLVLRDLELLRRFKKARVNLSITTDDEAVRRKFEPSCPSISQRLDALAQLKAAGIRTGACLCPLLPVRDPEGFARKLRSLEPDRVAVSGFHEGQAAFRAGTRDAARQIAQQAGWDRRALMRTIARMQAVYPSLREGGDAFVPE